MPNRVIKESIVRSEKLSKLSDFEFRLWVTLIALADDYGCGEARPEIIKGSGFPLRERITKTDIARGLTKLADVGCIDLYEIDGIPYLHFPNWFDHQRQRVTKHRYPEPPWLSESAATCGNLPPESESESENESETEKEAKASCADRPKSGKSAPTPSDFNIYLNDGTLYNVPIADVEDYKRLYPNVNVEQQLRNMEGWSKTAGSKRKTKRGVKAFITRWLTREQDKCGGRGQRGGFNANNRGSSDEQPRRVGCETIL